MSKCEAIFSLDSVCAQWKQTLSGHNVKDISSMFFEAKIVLNFR